MAAHAPISGLAGTAGNFGFRPERVMEGTILPPLAAIQAFDPGAIMATVLLGATKRSNPLLSEPCSAGAL